MPDSTPTIIRVNRLFVEYREWHGYKDLDSFGLKYAEAFATHLQMGFSLVETATQALGLVRTQFFRVNKASRDDFLAEFVPSLKGLVTEHKLGDFISRFKLYAERQLVHKLRADQGEETFRSFLQTHLDGNFLTFREVESGGGR